jgi:hypothetical protein
MKRLCCALSVLAGVLLLPSFAPALAGPYAGASFGQASTDVQLSDLDDGSTLSSGSVDDTSTCWKIYGGFRAFKFFSVEAGYTDLGEVSANAVSDGSGLIYDAGDVASTYEAEALSVATLGVLPLGRVNLFAKVGYMFWDADASLSNSAFGDIVASDDGEDVMYGAGLVWDYKGLGELRFEYETAEVAATDINTLSAGVSFLF